MNSEIGRSGKIIYFSNIISLETTVFMFSSDSDQPRVLLILLKGGEPHEPVEAVVVGGEEAGRPVQLPRLALELVRLP